MYDILIIGSGPAGCAAAVYGKRAGLSVLVVEKEYEGIGQIAESGRVDNYPGLPGISGYELGERFREHAVSLGAEFAEAEVTRIVPGDGCFTLLCQEGMFLQGKTVICAPGASPRKAGIPGEEALTGAGVSYCALCDGSFYQGARTAVLGGGDAALDDALYLADLCQKVTLVHRRQTFRGAESTVKLLKEKKNVEMILGESAEKICGETEVTGLTLTNGQTISVEGVFVGFGSVPRTELLQGLADMDPAGYVLAGETCETGTPGLYAAGDIRAKQMRQVVTAVADGANAAAAAADFIKRKENPQHLK